MPAGACADNPYGTRGAPSQVPCGPWTLWETGDARGEADVLAEVPAQALGEELLPALAILGIGGIRVAFTERRRRRVALPRLGVDARRRREK